MSRWEIVIDGCGGLIFNYFDQAQSYAASFLSGREFYLREIQLMNFSTPAPQIDSRAFWEKCADWQGLARDEVSEEYKRAANLLAEEVSSHSNSIKE